MAFSCSPKMETGPKAYDQDFSTVQRNIISLRTSNSADEPLKGGMSNILSTSSTSRSAINSSLTNAVSVSFPAISSTSTTPVLDGMFPQIPFKCLTNDPSLSFENYEEVFNIKENDSLSSDGENSKELVDISNKEKMINSFCAHMDKSIYCMTCCHILCKACEEKHNDHLFFLFEISEDFKSISILKEIMWNVYYELNNLLQETLKIPKYKIDNFIQNLESDLNFRSMKLIENVYWINRTQNFLLDIIKEKIEKEYILEKQKIESLINMSKTNIFKAYRVSKKMLNMQKKNEKKEKENFFIKYGSDPISLRETKELIKSAGIIRNPSDGDNKPRCKAYGTALEILVLNQKMYFTFFFNHFLQENSNISSIDEFLFKMKYPDGKIENIDLSSSGHGFYLGEIYSNQERQHELMLTWRFYILRRYLISCVKKRKIADLKNRICCRTWTHKSTTSYPGTSGLINDKDGIIYTTDIEKHCVRIFNIDLIRITEFGKLGDAEGEFKNPNGIAIYKGKVIVADTYNNRIQAFTRSGKFLFQAKGNSNAFLNLPWDVATNLYGNIAVSNRDDYKILLFDRNGIFLFFIDLYSFNLETPLGRINFERKNDINVSTFTNEFVELSIINNKVENSYIKRYPTFGYNYNYNFGKNHFETSVSWAKYDGNVIVGMPNKNIIQIRYKGERNQIIKIENLRSPVYPSNITVCPDGKLCISDGKFLYYF